MKKHILKRLYVEHSLRENAIITLSKDQAHYMRNVMRMKADDDLLLFNGHDGEWHAKLTTLDKKDAQCSISTQSRAPYTEPELTLAFAPVKGSAMETIITKATELGVTKLQPVMTQRTIIPNVNTNKWQHYITDASQQCERMTLPHILPTQDLNDFLSALDTPTLWCDETGSGKPVSPESDISNISPRAVLIGPEGGFSDSEISILQAHDHITPISLGPRILRADTACIAILSLWQACYGDWQDKRPNFRYDT